MSPTRLSRLESATRVVLEFNEAFSRHDVAGMMELMPLTARSSRGKVQ